MMEKVQLILQLLQPYTFIPISTVIREMRVALCYVTSQCGRKNIFREIKKKKNAHKKLKKPPKKVAYLWQLGLYSLQP